MRQYIDAAGQRVVHSSSILRMSEDRLVLRVSYIYCRFHDCGVHIHRWLRSHKGSGEQLDAVEASFHILARHLLGVFWAGGFRELHLGRQINRVPILGKDVARHQDSRPGDFPGFNPPTNRHRVVRLRAKVPRSRDTPAGQHLLHVGVEFRCGSVCRILPSGFKVHVAIPEACNDHFALAVEPLCRLGKIVVNLGLWCDGFDLAVFDQ